jgi:hypothetical protein
MRRSRKFAFRFQNQFLKIQHRFKLNGIQMHQLLIAIFRLPEINGPEFFQKRQTAGEIDMLRGIVFIRAVFMILPGEDDERVARFQHRLLFIEMVKQFSFRNDENFDVIAVRMIKRRRFRPDMERKIFFSLQNGGSARFFHVRKKIVRRRYIFLFIRDVGVKIAVLSVFTDLIFHRDIVASKTFFVKRKDKKCGYFFFSGRKKKNKDYNAEKRFMEKFFFLYD